MEVRDQSGEKVERSDFGWTMYRGKMQSWYGLAPGDRVFCGDHLVFVCEPLAGIERRPR